MSTPQTYELGWLSYLSNILSPTSQKVGGGQNKISARFARRICPITFKTVAPPLNLRNTQCRHFIISLLFIFHNKQGIHRHQTSPRYPQAAVMCNLHSANYGQMWRHLWNRKYITYRNAATGGPSQGPRGPAHRSSWRWIGTADGQTRTQTDKPMAIFRSPPEAE